MESSNSQQQSGRNSGSSSPLSELQSPPPVLTSPPITGQQRGSQGPHSGPAVTQGLGAPAVTENTATADTATAATTSGAWVPAMPSIEATLEGLPEDFFDDLPSFESFDFGRDNSSDPWTSFSLPPSGPTTGAGQQPDQRALATASASTSTAATGGPSWTTTAPSSSPAAAAQPVDNASSGAAMLSAPAPVVLGTLPPAVIEHAGNFSSPSSGLLRWISGPHQQTPAVTRMEATGGLLGPEGNQNFTRDPEAGPVDGPLPLMFVLSCLEDETFGLPPIIICLYFVVISVAATHEWGNDFLASGHVQVILNKLHTLLAGANLPYGPPSMTDVEDIFNMFRMAEQQEATHRRWTDPTGLLTGLCDSFRHWAEFLRTEWRERTNGLDWLLKGLTRGFISKRDEEQEINLEGFWNPTPRRRPIFEQDFNIRAPVPSLFHYLVKLLHCLLEEAVICDIRVQNPKDARDKEEWEGHSHFIAKQKGANNRRRQVGRRKSKGATIKEEEITTPASTATPAPMPAPARNPFAGPSTMPPPPLPFAGPQPFADPSASYLQGAYLQPPPPVVNPYLASVPAPPMGWVQTQQYAPPMQAAPQPWPVPIQHTPTWGMPAGAYQQPQEQVRVPRPVPSAATLRMRRRQEAQRNVRNLPPRQSRAVQQQQSQEEERSEESAPSVTTQAEVAARPGEGSQSRRRGHGEVDPSDDGNVPKRRRTSGIGEDAAQEGPQIVSFEQRWATEEEPAPWNPLGGQELVGEYQHWSGASGQVPGPEQSEEPLMSEANIQALRNFTTGAAGWSAVSVEQATPSLVPDSGRDSGTANTAATGIESAKSLEEELREIESWLNDFDDLTEGKE